jgi:DNA-binding SARP family transcriptional activator
MLVTFGRPHLTGTDGQPAYHGLLSMEIATYLALHPDGASTATLVDRLLPDADPARARNQIHQGVRRLRDACRHTCGTTITIDSAKGVYRLRLHGAARCDLWDFQTALDDADHARDDDERTTALGRAVHAYTGRFADGIDAPWAEGPATTLAQQALDAARDLADLLADHDPAGAVAILEQALLHDPDPHAEAAHTHLMRLHAHTGHPADVRRVYHRLEHRLAEIGASPTPATTDLLARLLRPRTPPVR